MGVPIKRLITLVLAALAVIFMAVDGASVLNSEPNFLLVMVLSFVIITVILACMGRGSQSAIILDITFGVLVLLFWAHRLSDMGNRSGMYIATVITATLTGVCLILFSFV